MTLRGAFTAPSMSLRFTTLQRENFRADGHSGQYETAVRLVSSALDREVYEVWKSSSRMVRLGFAPVEFSDKTATLSAFDFSRTPLRRRPVGTIASKFDQ